jgi:hypothetical protein
MRSETTLPEGRQLQVREEEFMGRSHSRLGVYALAVLTCLVLFGADNAFAANKTQPRVEGAGWYFNTTDQEVKLGLTANFTSTNGQQGRFEVFNKNTGATVKGRIMTWSFIADGACGPPPDPGFIGPPAGAPGASLHGVCDDGNTCNFDMNVVDGGNKRSSDFVCMVHVNGTDKKGRPITENQDNPQPLDKGKINVKQAQ